ncbi:MAG: arginine--tRNA ligase, partial [Actinobacteria bacterium]|nr:arginine--tRNA ligase [Actinomycetota bacterium]
MTPDDIARHVFEALSAEATRQGGSLEALTIDDIVIERPKNRDHGDWASSAALKAAKQLGVNPRDLAATVAGYLAAVDGIARA